jgi:hypothetical protein
MICDMGDLRPGTPSRISTTNARERLFVRYAGPFPRFAYVSMFSCIKRPTHCRLMERSTIGPSGERSARETTSEIYSGLQRIKLIHRKGSETNVRRAI